MQALHDTRLHALAALQWLEYRMDRIAGSSHNPLRQLGALGFLLFWLLAVSGIYLYAMLDTSAEGAYRSIEQLSRERGSPGGILRSLHRYGADAFLVVMLLHLVREGLLGRYRRFQRFSWWTGIPLLLLAFTSAIGGFWLNWDQLGQFSAMATAQLLDVLPLFAAPLTRNFLFAGSVSDRLFSLLVFVHIGVALFLLFGLWFHIQRLAHAATFPPRAMAILFLLALLALALAAPVQSHPPADMALAPTTLTLDWLALFIHPLAQATAPELVWVLLVLCLAFLIAMPVLGRSTQPPVAVVDPANCNGCRRCFDDCPYTAVTMVAHPTRRGREMAQVDANLCASCGICVGACPSSTPFRRAIDLVTGIDMPAQPINALRAQLAQGLAKRDKQQDRIVVFGCRHGPAVQRLASDSVLPLELTCVAQLPPSFVEYALRDGAAGVLVAGCPPDACAWRLGQRWTAQRLQATRAPRLRAHVGDDQLGVCWSDAADDPALQSALDDLRRRIAAATATTGTAAPANATGAATRPQGPHD